MKTLHIIALLITAICFPGRADMQPREKDDLIVTSLVRLVSNPDLYNEKRVMIQGYYVNRFEESGLYLSKDDAKTINGQQGLWVGPPKAGVQIKYPNKEFISIVGTFKYVKNQGAGHMGLWFAELDEIEEIHID